MNIKNKINSIGIKLTLILFIIVNAIIFTPSDVAGASFCVRLDRYPIPKTYWCKKDPVNGASVCLTYTDRMASFKRNRKSRKCKKSSGLWKKIANRSHNPGYKVFTVINGNGVRYIRGTSEFLKLFENALQVSRPGYLRGARFHHSTRFHIRGIAYRIKVPYIKAPTCKIITDPKTGIPKAILEPKTVTKKNKLLPDYKIVTKEITTKELDIISKNKDVSSAKKIIEKIIYKERKQCKIQGFTIGKVECSFNRSFINIIDCTNLIRLSLYKQKVYIRSNSSSGNNISYNFVGNNHSPIILIKKERNAGRDLYYLQLNSKPTDLRVFKRIIRASAAIQQEGDSSIRTITDIPIRIKVLNISSSEI